MEIIRIIDSIKKKMTKQHYIQNEVFMIKDEVADVHKLKDNTIGYLPFMQVVNVGFDTADTDSMEIMLGIAVTSTDDDSDYMQTMAKALYALKTTLLDLAFVDEEKINDIDIKVDSERTESSVYIVCYTTVVIEWDVSYAV